MRDVELVSKKMVNVPIEIFEKNKIASKAAIIVLLYICSYNITEIDISQISSMTGYDEEDVGDAINFWMSLGILRDRKKTLSEVVEEKLKLILSRPPLQYEIEYIISAYDRLKIEDEDLIAGVLDLCYSRQRTDLEWAIQILESCSKSNNPRNTLEMFVKYYSLTEKIVSGFNITRRLTSNEKKIILGWANLRVPLAIIFEAFAKSQRYIGGETISFPYINKIVQEILEREKDELVINDYSVSELGY